MVTRLITLTEPEQEALCDAADNYIVTLPSGLASNSQQQQIINNLKSALLKLKQAFAE